jgi:hypothetical protein
MYVGVPYLQGDDSDPQAHLVRGSESTGVSNSLVPHSFILNFLLDS